MRLIIALLITILITVTLYGKELRIVRDDEKNVLKIVETEKNRNTNLDEDTTIEFSTKGVLESFDSPNCKIIYNNGRLFYYNSKGEDVRVTFDVLNNLPIPKRYEDRKENTSLEIVIDNKKHTVRYFGKLKNERVDVTVNDMNVYVNDKINTHISNLIDLGQRSRVAWEKELITYNTK